MDLTYTKVGDYYIPDFALDDDTEYEIGHSRTGRCNRSSEGIQSDGMSRPGNNIRSPAE